MINAEGLEGFMMQREMLDCVNDRGRTIAPVARHECHGNPYHIHRVVHVMVTHPDGRILAQLRSKTKDIQPGRWDTAVGGHVIPGEDVMDAAVREFEEELGVTAPVLTFACRYRWLTDLECEEVHSFTAVHSGPFNYLQSEIDALEFLSADRLAEYAARDLMTPNFRYELALFNGDVQSGGDYPIRSILDCTLCPRLAEYRRSVQPRGRHSHAEYWNKPVPGFGDPAARLLIVGLAPGANGANRTGRPFTGDDAGVHLYRVLHDLGLSSQPEGTARGDGLWLRDVFITNCVKCVPPENKPLPQEVRNCGEYLRQELRVLTRVQGIVALGRTAYDAAKRRLAPELRAKDHPFEHGRIVQWTPGGPAVLACYHPSRRNMNTGLFSVEALREALRSICGHCSISVP